jgi:hypothetical protein
VVVGLEVVPRRGREPCLSNGDREAGACLHTGDHDSEKLLEFAERARDPEEAVSYTRNQGCACYRDLEKGNGNGKGLGAEE